MNAKLYGNRVPYDTVLHSGAKFHHRATAQGYVSRKPDEPKNLYHIFWKIRYRILCL